MAADVTSTVKYNLTSLTRGNTTLNIERKIGKKPVLGYVLVGNNPDSHHYVKLKKKACLNAELDYKGYVLPESTTQNELESVINDMNHNELVSGIMVQLPLPQHLDSQRILELINAEKDVDGLHPYNVTRILLPEIV
jgi:methylenetetrahydrofolate dehydrogenase (NADP+)/methenyltetrahydrofolate cyclohydrolase